MYDKIIIAEDLGSINEGILQVAKKLQINEVNQVQYCEEAYLKIKKAFQEQQPYQLLILSNKKDIYRFESNILIPKDILKNNNEFERLFKRCLGNGEWRLLNKSGDYLISEKDLPQNIKNFFLRLINN